MNNCPLCQSKVYETCDLMLFSDANSPSDYSEPYLVCSRCPWTDKPAVNINEEIQF